MSFENRACLGNVMKIKELNLRNFRGFQELEIKFSSSNLAVFIGINGAGKTSILDCIAIFLSRFVSKIIKIKKEDDAIAGFPLMDNDINAMCPEGEEGTHNTITIKVGYSISFFQNKDISWDVFYSQDNTDNEVKDLPEDKFIDYLYEKNLEKTHDMFYFPDNMDHAGVDDLYEIYIKKIHGELKNNPLLNLPILVYYQTNRAIISNSFRPSKTKFGANQFFAYQNVFTKNITDLSDFISWFRFEEDLENEVKIKKKDFNAININLEVVRRSITAFLNQFPACEFSDLHIERESRDGKFTFHSLKKSSLVIKKNGQDLKIEQLSAGEQIVLMMVSDIARRLAIANPSLPDPLQGEGIVLIDEIELHLHPQWQRQIIPSLLHTFPNIQFIITTHSPQVLSNVEKEEVFILEDFKIIEKTPHTKGRDSNSVLYELLGVEERPKEYKDKLSQLYRLIDDAKFSEAKEILSELTEKFGEHDTEIVRANMHLNLAEEDMNEIHQKG